MRLLWLVGAELLAVLALPTILRAARGARAQDGKAWRTPAEQREVDGLWQAGDKMSDRRRVDIFYSALELVGLSAAKNPAEFRAALGIPPPGGGFDIAHPYYQDESGQTHGVSTCALVAREILRRAGCAVPSLQHPYEIGAGFSDVIEAAQRAGCLVLDPRLTGADVGDAIIWGGPSPAPGMAAPGHVATIVAIDPAMAITVDGGLTDMQGLQRIGVTSRHRPFALGAPLCYIRSRDLPWA